MKLEGFSCYIGRVEIKVKPKSERVEAYYQERFLEFRSRAQNRGVMVEFGCSGVFFFIRFHLGLLWGCDTYSAKKSGKNIWGIDNIATCSPFYIIHNVTFFVYTYWSPKSVIPLSLLYHLWLYVVAYISFSPKKRELYSLLRKFITIVWITNFATHIGERSCPTTTWTIRFGNCASSWPHSFALFSNAWQWVLGVHF